MSRKSKNILFILFMAFALALIALGHYFNTYTEQYAIQEAEKSVKDALLTHRAIHKYVTKVSRPEIYRIKSEGKLYEDYFSPKTMSFTYTARGIKNFLNEERVESGLPQIYFKLASTNPRNEINRADEKEAELLIRMNNGQIDEYREIVQQPDGKKSLYYALATKPIVKGCLKCHGEPQDAPAEMVAQYPQAAGYFEEIGDIRALISVRIPLESYLSDGKYIANSMLMVSLIVLSIIYGISWFFVRHSDQQQTTILEKNRELQQNQLKLEEQQSRLEDLVQERTVDLLSAKEEAERANKAKSQFLANISHELRTPMHSILSFTALGRKKTREEKSAKYFGNISQSGQRLMTLINDLLDISKLEAGRMEVNPVRCNFSDIIYQQVESLSSLLNEKNIKVNLTPVKELYAVLDDKLISQVIVNILSNAIKFSPEESEITLDFGLKQEMHPGIDMPCVYFSAIDEGIGIPAKEIDKIFDKFYETNHSKIVAGGTGLGLTISREILKLHKGVIWAESPPENSNKGTKVEFQIPVKASNRTHGKLT